MANRYHSDCVVRLFSLYIRICSFFANMYCIKERMPCIRLIVFIWMHAPIINCWKSEAMHYDELSGMLTLLHKKKSERSTPAINPVTTENKENSCYKCTVGKPLHTTVNWNLELSAGHTKMHGFFVLQHAKLGRSDAKCSLHVYT